MSLIETPYIEASLSQDKGALLKAITARCVKLMKQTQVGDILECMGILRIPYGLDVKQGSTIPIYREKSLEH